MTNIKKPKLSTRDMTKVFFFIEHYTTTGYVETLGSLRAMCTDNCCLGCLPSRSAKNMNIHKRLSVTTK